jgi:cold shock CspA family protein
VGKDIIFSSYTCTGGLEEFKTIYALKEKGEKINVTYNVENSPKGPMAVNVSVVK